MSMPASSEDPRSDRALLRAFRAPDAADRDAAWQEFLRRHSDLILKIASEFAPDHDALMETYLYVCEHLVADELARFRDYDPTRGQSPTQVSTWLTVVVRNLCIDHYRQKEGRKRYPEAVAKGSALDRKVYELYVWEGYSEREIVSKLEVETQYDADAVSAALDRLRELRPDPLNSWTHEPPREGEPFEAVRHETSDASGQRRRKEDRSRWIEELLRDLPSDERRAVLLYYWSDLSAGGIGRLLQVSQRSVYSLLNRGLQTLREKMDLLPTAEP